ncbi:MAG TPA: ABC transporter substrate-binding protein [Caldilineaceae bacterium]|nr:ABC transporter substrate-binding protein [Caldilineaceae bacterium]
MNRKLYALLGLLLVCTLALAGCPAPGAAPAQQPAAGGEEQAAGGEAGGGEAGEVVVRAMLEATSRDFDTAAVEYCEQETGITIEVLNGPESATDRLAQYLQFFGAQSPDVDVMQIDVIWPGILAEHLVDLTPYVGDAINDYFPAIVENNTVDGALVGIPWFTDAGLLYYRTDLLEKYGYDGPPETWAELEEMATTIQEGERAEGNPDFWGYVWQGAAYEGLTCNALEWQVSWGGGQIVEPDGTISINNEQAASSFDMAAGWVDTISPPGVVSYMEEDARGVWQAGNAAFMRNWPYAYSLGNAEDSVIRDKFGVVPLPRGEGPDARHADTLGGWQMAVSRYSQNIDAAAEVAVCLSSRESQKIRATVGSMLPTIGDLYQDEEVLEANPFFGQLYDVFAGGAVARPSTVTGEDYNQVSTIYFTEVNEVLTGQQSGQEAVEQIESQLQSLLQ